jgi:hypothetical protein
MNDYNKHNGSMKKLFKFLGYLSLGVIILAGSGLAYIKTALPDVGAAEEIKIDYTPERIERGAYLANHVTVCMDCHSTRDWSKFSGPLTEGTLGKGGERFDQKMQLPGVFYSKNITPEGIQRYSDGELVRLITTGVNKEGRAMFPLMPFRYYGQMDLEDLYSIIAYVRTLDPIKNDVPESISDFPMNIIINTLPQKAALRTRPEPSDVLAYGSYLTNATACAECHTQVDKGQIIPELVFGGGREFTFPNGSVVRTANITPDAETGIGTWTKEQFIARFKAYADGSYTPQPVGEGDYNTFMPWTMYAGMSEEDLGAIYTYLRTVKPIQNKVVKFTAMTTQ